MPDPTVKIEDARFIITMDPQRRIIGDGTLVVQGQRIVQVGKAAELAEFQADRVIDASQEDPVTAVRRLTNGAGAHLVVYAVGGPAGPKAFDQGLDMLGTDGTLHLIGLYEDQDLALPSGKIQRRRILGGYYGCTIGLASYRRAMSLLASGGVQAERMTTHRFPFTDAGEAFDLLWNRPGEALGVLLDWEQ